MYSLLGQTEGERRPFLGWCNKRAASGDYPQEVLVVLRDEKSLSSFEIRNNPTPTLLFIRPPYK